jgi:hypothetical protein
MLVLSAPRLRLWPPSTLGSKPAPGGAGLDDPGDGAGIDRHAADAGQGGVASVPLARRPDPPEEGARDDPGRLPGPHSADRTELGGAVGEGDGDAAAGALALGVRQGQVQAAFAGLEVLYTDGGQLGAAERAGEADQQQRAVAQSGKVGCDRR